MLSQSLLELNESFNRLWNCVASRQDPELNSVFLESQERLKRVLLIVERHTTTHYLDDVRLVIEDYEGGPTEQLSLFPKVTVTEVIKTDD